MQAFSNKHSDNNKSITMKPPRSHKKSGDKYLFFSCCRTDDVVSSACVTSLPRREDEAAVEMEANGDVILPPAEVGGGRHGKKDHRKIITRVLKAVLFDTIMAKKIKKRKLLQKLHKSNEKLERCLRPNNKDRKFSDGEEIVFDTKNVTKKSKLHPLKSWNPPSVYSNTKTLSARTFDCTQVDSNVKNQGLMSKPGNGMHSYSSGLCLILLSLLVVVMWGKVCAIVCTSLWLFVVPFLGSGNKPFRLMDDSRKIDSKEHKKKIIMEGLLQRNRNKGSSQ